MSSRTIGLLLAGLLLLGGCQRDINHRPARIAVTSLVSLGNGGIPGNGASSAPTVSPDGRYVAFVSTSTNLTGDSTGGHLQVYRRDLLTGTTLLISVDGAGHAGDQDSDSPTISADGLRIAFRSVATTFSADANGGFGDIYLRDLSVDPPQTLLLTGAAGGGPNDGGAQFFTGCFAPSISQDGKYVAFLSDATTLTSPPLAPAFVHAFRRSVDGLLTELVDLQPSGVASGSAVQTGVSISSDGRYVAFDSSATDLGAPGPGGPSNVYIRDMTLTVAAVELVSVSLDPSAVDPSAKGSRAPSMSADGRVVAFQSDISNLVPDDANGAIMDVFVRDLRDPLHPVTFLVSRNSSGTVGSGISSAPALAADGGSVAFLSEATNLVDGDFNGTPDVFWHELSTGKTVRVSVSTDLQEAIGTASGGFGVSGDGREIFFSDQASNLVAGDLNGTSDVFLRGPMY